MAIRLSTGLVNKMMDTGSFKDIFANAVLDIYSGTQPADADTAASGTALVLITKASGAYTAETRSIGSLTLAGASGSVNTVTVNAIDILGGAVSFNTSLNQTAVDVALQINRNPKNLQFVASATGASAVVTITAANGLGTLPNAWVVAATYTTMTGTPANMAGGVNAVNGLTFDIATIGAASKIAADTWSGNGITGGTAGWFRLRESGDTGTGASTTACRIDGSIATSGADMNLGSLTVTATAPFILTSAAFTLPKV
jgi:hypothetical protein